MNDPGTRAQTSLEGLSVGDAFAWHCMPGRNGTAEQMEVASAWHYTAATMMASSVVAVLLRHGHIDQTMLAHSIAAHYEYSRGYGAAMHHLFRGVSTGSDWKVLVSGLLETQGGQGDEAATYVAPVGAYYSDDLHSVVEQSVRAAEITTLHDESIAGAIAVGIAVAHACRMQTARTPPRPDQFLDLVLPSIPEGQVRSGIRRARELGADIAPDDVASVLGSASLLPVALGVPYALWCAAQSLGSYETAIRLAMCSPNAQSTSCAIVGGIVSAYTGVEDIPKRWRTAREPLPAWAFEDGA